VSTRIALFALVLFQIVRTNKVVAAEIMMLTIKKGNQRFKELTSIPNK